MLYVISSRSAICTLKRMFVSTSDDKAGRTLDGKGLGLYFRPIGLYGHVVVEYRDAYPVEERKRQILPLQSRRRLSSDPELGQQRIYNHDRDEIRTDTITQAGRHAGTQAGMQAGKEAGKEAGRQAAGQRGGQRDNQADWQTV